MSYPYPYPYTYAPPEPLPTPPRATAAMVLGIIGVAGSIFVLPVLVSPLAWYFGAVAEREAEREPTRYRRGGAAKTGMVLGIIGTALLGVFLLLLLVIVTFMVIATRYDAGYGT